MLCARTYNPKLQQSDMKLLYFFRLLRGREEREPEQEDSEEVENEARIKKLFGIIAHQKKLVIGLRIYCYTSMLYQKDEEDYYCGSLPSILRANFVHQMPSP